MVHDHLYHLSPDTAPYGFLALLVTGLFIGLSHCMGMCGPLVSAFMIQRRVQRSTGQLDATTSLMIYQLGRLTTYLLLGLLAGSVGAVLYSTFASQGWQSALSILMGLLMIFVGLTLLGLLPGQRYLAALPLAHRVGGWIRALMRSKYAGANFALGLSNGLLPCGPVYAMTMLAAATGDSLRGAILMLIFGLGTLPAMLGVGLFATQLSVRLRSHLYRVAAALILLTGLQLVLRGLALNNQVAHLSIGGFMLW